MSLDLVCHNGKLMRWDTPQLRPQLMLGRDFVYQRIHVMETAPLHVAAALSIAESSALALYGQSTGLSEEELTQEIGSLASANRYIYGSVEVILYLFPSEGEYAERLLVCGKQYLYKGYAMWHNRYKGMLAPYDYPFPSFPTAVSLAAHNYATRYVAAKGADIAVAHNSANIITGGGEFPFFAVNGKEITTTSIANGVPDSVCRRLGIIACERADFRVTESAIFVNELDCFDEFFIATPEGTAGLGHFNGKPYPNSTARQAAEMMAAMYDHPLL